MDIFRLLYLLLDQFGWTAEMNVTGTTEVDEAIPNFWAPGIITDADRESFWGSLTGGEGSRMPVIMKTGQLREKGDYITFNTIEQLMGTGRTAANVLKGYEEKMGIGSFSVSADVVRHAVAVNRKANKQANFDMIKQAGLLLKDWFSRKFDYDCFSAILSSDDVETLYAGDSNSAVGSLNATNGDYFGIAEIEMLGLALKRQGATPLKITRVNQRTIPIYGCVFGEIEEYRLSQNSTFTQIIRESLERYKKGGEHPLFRGALGIYKNMLLYPYYSVLPIPQGTPLRPETTVFTELTTTATTVSVGGASVAGPASEDVTPDYTLYFASSGSIQVEDEIISYTEKTKNTFVCDAGRGASSTTATTHVVNKLVTQREIATVIGFGAEAIFKAMPENVETIGDKDDYGEQIGVGVRAYYGQSVKLDKRRAKANNCIKMKVLSTNPGTV